MGRLTSTDVSAGVKWTSDRRRHSCPVSTLPAKGLVDVAAAYALLRTYPRFSPHPCHSLFLSFRTGLSFPTGLPSLLLSFRFLRRSLLLVIPALVTPKPERRRRGGNPGRYDRSAIRLRHWGLISSIRFIFHAHRHFLICFSRSIASFTSPCRS